ncbi:kinase-like domain-containing protein [Chlamydoabsidia padenii]|nr:kinase-like domain-containing protein [Chlamydoabsidia padenii]
MGIPPAPQPQKNHQQNRHSELAQQFIFEKPMYNQHHQSDRLERHDPFFEHVKHLFQHNPHNIHHTSSHPKDSPTFGNEFNKDLEQRYGKRGSFIGEGSSGSVRIIRRATDNKVFAVKEYEKRRSGESERSYVKKVTAEFCIGSTLHNENIIETLDIIQKGNLFYQVMEYAPFDMLTLVMEGDLSVEATDCYWRQLLNGVAYLQNIGLGHRDLKLDNLVVDTHNVVKIIDFGTAKVVRYPSQKKEKLCTGIVGTDPYIAPEQYSQKEYSAFSADLWSCGIIFVCMVLCRFPWRIPRPGHDENYRLYLNKKNSLLANIPLYARPTIAQLLEPNPQIRPTLAMVLTDPWVVSISTCTTSFTYPSHHHHLLNNNRH